MRKIFLTVLLVAGAAWIGSNPLNACGDKFLLLGRGSSLGAYAAVHPATILIVRHGKTGSPLVIDDPQLASGLQRAGHKVRTLDSPAKLTQTLSATRFDVVLADLSDAVAIEPQVRDASAKPALVPVVFDPTANELASAEKQFVCLLKAPEKVTHFLGVIDDLMKSRIAAAKAGNLKSK